MTENEFRTSDAHRAELNEALNKPAVLAAIAILTDGWLGTAADIGAPEVVSVRLESQRAGFERAFQRLHELATPLPGQKEQPIPDWGNPEAAANLAAHEAGLPPPFKTTP